MTTSDLIKNKVECPMCYASDWNEYGVCKECGDHAMQRVCDHCGHLPTTGACFYCKMD